MAGLSSVKIWKNLEDFEGFGKTWKDLEGLGRIWKDFEEITKCSAHEVRARLFGNEGAGHRGTHESPA